MELHKLKQKVITGFLPKLVELCGVKRGSWRSEKYVASIVACIGFPLKRIRRKRRNTELVEHQYDMAAGSYIADNYYRQKMRYSVVDGGIKKISSIENMQKIRMEMRQHLRGYEFENILEVGVGELTTIEDIYSEFGPDLACYGVDLSLNRLVHGLEEYRQRHTRTPTVAKANALNLPFPDNSFDLVITRHTLEQMPTIYQRALSEILRVARRHVILFEPSFSLGSVSQKLKMLNNDYVRGISKHLEQTSNVSLCKPFLMENSANPLNHTACYKIEKLHSDSHNGSESQIPFVCPETLVPLEKRDTYYFSNAGQRAYPIVCEVPVLDRAYSFKLTGSRNAT